MDLRVIKTKRAIKGALTDLCSAKPLSEVTVKELCLRAEVSKPAFYYHYGNVGDVVDEIEDDAVNAIVEKTLDGRVDLASEETLRQFGEQVFHSPLDVAGGELVFRTGEGIAVEPPQLAPEDVFQQHMVSAASLRLAVLWGYVSIAHGPQQINGRLLADILF